MKVTLSVEVKTDVHIVAQHESSKKLLTVSGRDTDEIRRKLTDARILLAKVEQDLS